MSHEGNKEVAFSSPLVVRLHFNVSRRASAERERDYPRHKTFTEREKSNDYNE